MLRTKKRGRPRIHNGKRIALGLRVTPQMHSHLTTLAAQSGRSLSQEVELQLEFAALIGRSKKL
jgi:predicted HicB family RNase H-like nuclease